MTLKFEVIHHLRKVRSVHIILFLDESQLKFTILTLTI